MVTRSFARRAVELGAVLSSMLVVVGCRHTPVDTTYDLAKESCGYTEEWQGCFFRIQQASPEDERFRKKETSSPGPVGEVLKLAAVFCEPKDDWHACMAKIRLADPKEAHKTK